MRVDKSAMKYRYDKRLELYEKGDERGDIYKSYRDQEKLINKVFSDRGVFEKQTKLEEEILQAVLLRVVVLDSLYSTNLGKSPSGVYEMASYITNLEMDNNIHHKIRNASPHNYDELKDIVKQIAECNLEKTIKDKVIIIHPYSFATKYCFHYNQNAFRIYDSFVREMLVLFNNGKSDASNAKFADISREFGELVGTNFCGGKLIDTKLKKFENYDTFIQAIDTFATHYGLDNKTPQDRRALDHFLWILGKESRSPQAKQS